MANTNAQRLDCTECPYETDSVKKFREHQAKEHPDQAAKPAYAERLRRSKGKEVASVSH